MSDSEARKAPATNPAVEPSRLAKNTSYLTIASIVQKIFTFFYFIYVARGLGDVMLGQYTFALFYTSIFGIFLDLGFGPVLTREIAKRAKNQTAYFRAILGTKLVLAPIWLILMSVVIWTLYGAFPNVDLQSVQLVYWATPIILLDTFTFTFFSVFRGRQIMKYEAIGIMIYQLIIVSLGSLVLFFNQPVQYLILSIVAGSLFHFFYSGTLVVVVAKEKLRPVFDLPFTKKLIRIAIPFALAGIFFKLNGSVDTVMLKIFAGDQYVGWYAVAFKLTTALTVLPGAFATSYFPAISNALTQKGGRAGRIFERSMVYLMIIALPIAAGTFVLADQIVITLYTDVYGASANALRVFMASLIFVFLNYPVGNLLNAANKQTINTMNMGIALLTNIGLNFWLIPEYTFMGAAWSAAISTVLLILLGLPWTRKLINYRASFLFERGAKIILAAVLMGVFSYISIDLHLAINVALSAVVYSVLLVAFGIITRNDLIMLGNMARSAVKRVV